MSRVLLGMALALALWRAARWYRAATRAFPPLPDELVRRSQ